MWIGIGADIDSESDLFKTCREMNQILAAKYGARQGFSGSEHSHLNLYDLSVPEENLDQINEALMQTCTSEKKITLEVEKLDYFPFGTFFLKVRDNRQLSELHKRIVTAVSNLKGECLDPDYKSRESGYDSQQRELFYQYGNPFVLDRFMPHISVGHIRVSAEKLEEAKGELEKTSWSNEFKISSIHFIVERNGSHEGIYKFQLND